MATKSDIAVTLLCVSLFGAYYTNKTMTNEPTSSVIGAKSTQDSAHETKNNTFSNTNVSTIDTTNRMSTKEDIATSSTINRRSTDDTDTQISSTNQATIATQEEPSIPPETHEPTEIDLENQEQEAILEEIIEKQRQEDEEILLNPDKKVRRKW